MIFLLEGYEQMKALTNISIYCVQKIKKTERYIEAFKLFIRISWLKTPINFKGVTNV